VSCDRSPACAVGSRRLASWLVQSVENHPQSPHPSSPGIFSCVSDSFVFGWGPTDESFVGLQHFPFGTCVVGGARFSRTMVVKPVGGRLPPENVVSGTKTCFVTLHTITAGQVMLQARVENKVHRILYWKYHKTFCWQRWFCYLELNPWEIVSGNVRQGGLN
jgi:hypothetical protein